MTRSYAVAVVRSGLLISKRLYVVMHDRFSNRDDLLRDHYVTPTDDLVVYSWLPGRPSGDMQRIALSDGSISGPWK